MASPICPRPISPRLLLSSLILFLSISTPASSRPSPCHPFAFSFPDFSRDLHSLDLLGDALLSFPHSSVQISGSQPRSVGRLFYSRPIRFRSPRSSLSFSSSFSFSMSSQEGDGLAFVIVPDKNFVGATGPWLGLSSDKSSSSPLAHTFAVEFDSKMNQEVQDLNGNHVGLDVESLVSIVAANVSDIALTLNNGEQLYSWVDYHFPAKVLEVRLSKSQSQRPAHPILSHHVDLSNIWKDEMYVGFSSSTGDSPQKHMVHSWTFTSWDGSEHSLPAHPDLHGRPHKVNQFVRIGLALLLGVVSGAMAAVSLAVVWAFLRRTFSPSNGEVAMHPILFGYQQLTTESK